MRLFPYSTIGGEVGLQLGPVTDLEKPIESGEERPLDRGEALQVPGDKVGQVHLKLDRRL